MSEVLPVANELDPSETLMLQTHYVNAQTQGTPDGVGQVGINLWTIDPGQVTAQLGTVFATNQNIRVCQHNPTPTYSASCQFNSPQPVTVVGANGHFHSRGKEFDIFAWDGTSTTTLEGPLMPPGVTAPAITLRDQDMSFLPGTERITEVVATEIIRQSKQPRE